MYSEYSIGFLLMYQYGEEDDDEEGGNTQVTGERYVLQFWRHFLLNTIQMLFKMLKQFWTK